MPSSSILVGDIETLGSMEITEVLSQNKDRPQLNVRRPLAGHRNDSGLQLMLAHDAEDPVVDSMNAKAKPRQLLHLPSFRALGIAVPHLDLLLTPPNEDGYDLAWYPSLPKPLNFTPRLHCSPCSTMSLPTGCSRGEEPVASLPKAPDLLTMEETPNIINLSGRASEAEGYFITGGGTSAVGDIVETGDRSMPEEQSTTSADHPGWLQQALEMAVSDLTANENSNQVINVLAHTQPCPPSENAASAPTAFPALMTALQNKLPPELGYYIDVTHAMPSLFNMTKLPTSPPITPNPSSGVAGDYFNMTVFNKAVVAFDHHGLNNMGQTACSPHPIVPPSSIGFSLLERFIPPNSAAEFEDLFSSDGPSILLDRLVELSRKNGTLLFIYPTKAGATNFAKNYLGPILDPTLRTLSGIHNLASNLMSNIGVMRSVDKLLPFEGLSRKIANLLRKLNRGSSAIPQKSAPKYSLAHSSKQAVHVERKVWADWWTHQEEPSIRAMMDRYFNRAIMLPVDQSITAPRLVREIISGVKAREYDEDQAPSEPIEIGVFVIKRTA